MPIANEVIREGKTSGIFILNNLTILFFPRLEATFIYSVLTSLIAGASMIKQYGMT